MKHAATIATIGLCTLMAGAWGASRASVAAQPAAAALPPPGSRMAIGVLDPIHWRAVPPAGSPWAEWEKWTIDRHGRAAVHADVSAVAADANRLANRRVRVYGEFRTARAGDGTRVRYLRVQLIEPVR